jgi:hypothetical protein
MPDIDRNRREEQSRNIAEVLAEAAALARERGWTAVTDFFASLPSESDDTVLMLAAEGVEERSLADWIVSEAQPGAIVTTAPLEALAPDGGPGLAANRVVVVFQCGRLLMPEGVDAATRIFMRPAESFAVVFVGAEAITDRDDLDLVERGIWRVLVGDPGVEWAGQDLAARRCLLWSDGAGAGWPDDVATRVARDTAALARWLDAGVTVDPALARLRAAHAVELAADAAERSSPTVGDPVAAPVADSLMKVAADVDRLRGQLLRRLDADAEALERQVMASLRTLEQDLLHGVGRHLDRHREALGGAPALRRVVADYIGTGLDTWRAKTLADVLRRAGQSSAEAGELLDDVDWALVNRVAVHPGGEPYPEAIVARLRADAEIRLPGKGGPGDLGSPRLPDSAGLTSIARTAAFGGATAAVTALVVGPALLPITAAGALGVVGGQLANRYFNQSHAQRVSAAYARAAVSSTVGGALAPVRAQLAGSAAAAHQAVDAAFQELGRSLRSAAAAGTALGSEPAVTASAGDRARLAELRRRLGIDEAPTPAWSVEAGPGFVPGLTET